MRSVKLPLGPLRSTSADQKPQRVNSHWQKVTPGKAACTLAGLAVVMISVLRRTSSLPELKVMPEVDETALTDVTPVTGFWLASRAPKLS